MIEEIKDWGHGFERSLLWCVCVCVGRNIPAFILMYIHIYTHKATVNLHQGPPVIRQAPPRARRQGQGHTHTLFIFLSSSCSSITTIPSSFYSLLLLHIHIQTGTLPTHRQANFLKIFLHLFLKLECKRIDRRTLKPPQRGRRKHECIWHMLR